VRTDSALERGGSGIFLIALLLAGCSTTTQGASSLPAVADAISSNPMSATDPTLRLLERQADGELPGPISREAMQRELQEVQSQTRPRPLHRSGTVGLWASYIGQSELLGFNTAAHKVLAVVDTAANKCFGPNAVKVDREQNVWVACEGIGASSASAGQQEYGPDGTIKLTYAFDVSSRCSNCSVLSFDGGRDNDGHVFAELSIGSRETQRGFRWTNPGFYWWDSKNPSGPATFIRASHYCQPMCGVYYMDTDRGGNIWFDFAGNGAGLKGGLGEVTNPTTSPLVRVVFPAGTYRQPGGVYVSGHGTVLNVTDQGTRMTYQYHLPVTSSSTPFNALGPSVDAPVEGGFNKTETSLALGGATYGIQIGKLPVNTWKRSACALKGDEGACTGVAFTPSDK
jgi:hypothetical protein